MTFEDIVFRIGDVPVTLGALLALVGGVALVLLVCAVVLSWRGGRVRRDDALEAMRRTAEMEFRLAELSGQLKAFTDQAAHYDAHLARTLDERLDQVSLRLGQGLHDSAERTGLSLQALNERLAVIDTAQRNITELSSQMVTLRDVLANKQSRGAFGQARMEAIIRDGLPHAAFRFQATLSNGTRPDCLIKLPDSELQLIIDAKFPLEAFNALKEARADADVRQAEQRLRTDVFKHVKDIAQKYLIAGETHETAIMFVPSESVYADLYERFEDVIQKSHRERVIIASPNVLMLLIQTMQAIFKDARMREQAGQIRVEVARLMDDVMRMRTRVLDLQKHFGLAVQDVDKLVISSDKVAKRGDRIAQLDLAETGGRPGEDPVKPKIVAGIEHEARRP
jgi:DNA recombination protein RmuC